MKKLPEFVAKRRENWAYLRWALELAGFLILPEEGEDARSSWFGFLMTMREDSPVLRDDFVRHLEEHNIQTRPLLAGNLTRHPCFQTLEEGTDYRIAGPLTVADQVMNHSFWVGVYPGMEQVILDEIAWRILECGKNIV